MIQNQESGEMLDVVDEQDRVIGRAPRKDIHKTEKMHRSAHIFLLDRGGRIWLEKRASNTDTFPGYYNSSAAGHISSGESYLEGAKREIQEELGIRDLRLEQKHKLLASKDTLNEFVAFFTARSNKTPRVHENTEKLEAFSVQQIEHMINRGEKFTPIFLELFKWYRANA